jgi:hypothetical protein
MLAVGEKSALHTLIARLVGRGTEKATSHHQKWKLKTHLKPCPFCTHRQPIISHPTRTELHFGGGRLILSCCSMLLGCDWFPESSHENFLDLKILTLSNHPFPYTSISLHWPKIYWYSAFYGGCFVSGKTVDFGPTSASFPLWSSGLR